MTEFPDSWQHDTNLHDLLSDALIEADCSWLQTACTVGFLFACVMRVQDDEEMRRAVFEQIVSMTRAVVDGGALPGEDQPESGRALQ